MKSFFFLVLGVLLIGGSIWAFWNQELPENRQTRQLTIAGKTLTVEVADTPEKRGLGLSGREGLRQDEGMLFIFEEPGLYGFWMKDMKFSIDIIWINEARQVVDILKDARPETYPQIFSPKVPAKYVLEVPSGFSEKNSIEIGTEAHFD